MSSLIYNSRNFDSGFDTLVAVSGSCIYNSRNFDSGFDSFRVTPHFVSTTVEILIQVLTWLFCIFRIDLQQ